MPLFLITLKNNLLLRRALNLLVLWVFAVVQPIILVLFKDNDFFMTRHMSQLEALSGILLVSWGVPIGLALLYYAMLEILHRLRQPLLLRLESNFYFCLFAILSALTIFLFFKYSIHPALTGTVFEQNYAIMGVAVGLVFAILAHRFASVRLFVTFLLPCVAVVPLWFVATSPFFDAPPKTAQKPVQLTHIKNNIPIVMIVFDEFPTTSLLDARQQIDPVRYPNFAAFAKDATWYRNATTVHSVTTGAVPAILSGQFPRTAMRRGTEKCVNPLPVPRQYPNTVFSLLAPFYRLHVFESYIYLCPEGLCAPRQNKTDWPSLLAGQWQVLRISAREYIFGMVFNNPRLDALYAKFRRITRPPSLSSTFTHQSDVNLVDQFLDSLQPANPLQSFYFAHPLLPHSSWEFYPSGRTYLPMSMVDRAMINCDSRTKDPFCKNSWRTAVLYQRHLLQVGYVDTILGQMLAKLKATGIYDKAMVIVLADHGISFLPGDLRRHLTPTNFGDILPVPLLVKFPGQYKGVVDDALRLNIDVLPTIAEVLGHSQTGFTEGQSLLHPPSPQRNRLSTCSPEEKMVFSAQAFRQAKEQALQRKLALFGDGQSRPDGLFDLGTYKGLIGRKIDSLGRIQPSDIQVMMDFVNRKTFERLNPKSSMPLMIKGQIRAGRDADKIWNVNLAVVTHGRIQTVTQTFHLTGDTDSRFAVLLPESALTPQDNNLGFLVIKGDPDHPQFFSTSTP